MFYAIPTARVVSRAKISLDVFSYTVEHKGIILNVLSGHAITGCDTVPWLFRKGKISPLKVLKDGYFLVRLTLEFVCLFVCGIS